MAETPQKLHRKYGPECDDSQGILMTKRKRKEALRRFVFFSSFLSMSYDDSKCKILEIEVYISKRSNFLLVFLWCKLNYLDRFFSVVWMDECISCRFPNRVRYWKQNNFHHISTRELKYLFPYENGIWELPSSCKWKYVLWNMEVISVSNMWKSNESIMIIPRWNSSKVISFNDLHVIYGEIVSRC